MSSKIPTAIPIATYDTSIQSTPSIQSNPTSSQVSIDIEDITYQEIVDTNNTVVNINANPTLKKVYYLLSTLIVELPFIILYCYFAVNDNSCSYKYVDPYIIPDIHIYLVISSVVLSVLMVVSLICILHVNFENIQSINDYFITICSLYFIFIMFMFIWSVAVGFTFFNSNVNIYCSHMLRDFMNLVLLIFYILGIVCSCIICHYSVH